MLTDIQEHSTHEFGSIDKAIPRIRNGPVGIVSSVAN